MSEQATYVSDPGRHVYVYDYRCSPSDEWRVYEGVLLDAAISISNVYRLGNEGKALIAYVSHCGGLQVQEMRHLKHRNSAAVWVFAHEFNLLAEDVEADYASRQIWRKAYDDIQRIKARAAALQSKG